MRRLALTLATAVLASGCIVGDDNHNTLPPPGATGSVIVYWDFLRNTQSGTVLYDDANLTRTGTGPCAQSAVELVTIDAAGLPQFVVDCVYQGVQGATLDGLPAGSQSVRIRGWRGNYAVYDSSVALQVAAGATTDQGIIDLGAVRAAIDLYGDLAFGTAQTLYGTCAQADFPNISFDVWDSYGTKVHSGVAGCADPLPAAVFAGDLDLDNYTVRMKGAATQGPFSGQTVFDSCAMAFDHFGDQVGNAGVVALLRTQPIPTCQ